MKSIDLEQLNRENFRAMMDALSMPGSIKKIVPLYESSLLATANVLLYSEVSFFYAGGADMSLIEAITNAKTQTSENADYIFSDAVDSLLVQSAKRGDHVNPDLSSTLIFTCKDFKQTKVMLRGPGIDGQKELTLPCDKEFINVLMDKNSDYPLGIEIYFLNTKNEILALSRTTKIEVL